MQKPKVIVSYTSLPTRINHTKEMLDSLLNQSYKPDNIVLSLSRLSKRSPSEIMTYSNLPEFIKSAPIELKFCEDFGSNTKILPLLKEVSDPETIIVTVDDDTVYPENWLKNLVEYSISNPQVAVGYRGRVLQRDYLNIPFLNKKIPKKLKYSKGKTIILNKDSDPTNVDILTGVWGVLYKRSFFSEEVFSMNASSPAFCNDDIWIAGHLAKANIERHCIPPSGPFQDIHMEKFGIKRLWDSVNNGKGLNDKVIHLFAPFW